MSGAAIALWSIFVEPGKKAAFDAHCGIRITNVALGDKIVDENGRTTVKLTYPTPHSAEDDDDAPEHPETTTVLCSLTPGKIEQAVLDLVLEEDEQYQFELVGKNPVYLSGNYIDVDPMDSMPDLSDEDELSEEDAYDLRDVSSDVEMDPAELDGLEDSDEDVANRFEEVEDGPEAAAPKKTDSKKRPRDSEANESETPAQEGKQKKQKKKKNAAGEAVPANESEKPNGKQAGTPKKDGKAEKGEKAAKGGKTTEPVPGLKVTDITVGKGQTAKKGDTVLMRYIGKLDNGDTFDHNTAGKPFSFKLGAGEVIKGWDEGIAGMQVGGERKLVVPANLGYGKRKSAGIPANSTLNFEVKLIKIK